MPATWSYAYPWPDELPGLGRRTVGTYDLCADHLEGLGVPYGYRGEPLGTYFPGTWARYGDRPLCLACARQRERKA